MSWLLKQAEDILNRVDQQTNAAFQTQQKSNKTQRQDHEVEFITDSTSNRTHTPVNYFLPIPLKSSIENNGNHSPIIVNDLSTMKINRATPTTQVMLPLENDSIESLRRENQQLVDQQQKFERDTQMYKRQILQYQQQIKESDALLGHLRLRESDSNEILAAKDSQLNLLRTRINELEKLLSMTEQQLENQSTRSTNEKSTGGELLSLQNRLDQIEHENQRLIEEKQQNKQWKSLFQQLEQELNDYKGKAQRILQNKDQMIAKLQEIAQHRSSTPTSVDPHNENENQTLNADSTLFDVSQIVGSTTMESVQWLTMQNDQLKSENDLLKKELQLRETTIQHLREEMQQVEMEIEQNKEDFRQEIRQLTDQLDDERQRSNLLKQDFLSTQEDFKREKKALQNQISDREHELERLRQQLTSKTINQVHDEELERRLQTLTESVLHKQSLIECLQADKSSLNLKLERLEQRLDECENIRKTSKENYSNVSTMSIALDDNDSLENIRHRLPLLHETPTDVHLTKKVKRAANELDRWAMRLTIFLRRYPFVRLFVLFYIFLLHLWTLIVLCTYATEMHS